VKEEDIWKITIKALLEVVMNKVLRLWLDTFVVLVIYIDNIVI
jgi:hypothetical protein